MAEYEINIQNRAYVHTLIKLVAYFCESGVTKTTAVVMLLANHMKLMNTPIVVYCISIRSNYTIPTGQIIKCGTGQSFMTKERPKVRIM